jgi:hypothetical protein
MNPHIDSVRFGAITVAGQTMRHDIVITLDGHIRERAKNLSKRQYGTSHVLSLDEIQDVWEDGTNALLVGGGLFGRVRLAPDAQAFLAQHGCAVDLYPIGRAVRLWNKSQGKIVGLFHITC